MTINNELDINTLNWVKSEIDDTMKQARTSLESYIEDQKDESQLLFCINYLHQVNGTLQMVELYGASLLAEELEKLAKAIKDNKVKNKDEAFEVLIRGSIQLPDYLEKLQLGQKDTPIVLLPLFNDMRAARNEALLSETSLFNPNLAIEAPPLKNKDNTTSSLKHIAELAKEKRHQFHIGLLGWFKNENKEKSLGLISDVLQNLRKVSEEQNTSRMLWVAEGLIDSLKNKGVDTSVAVKSLVGQVDRTIKQIIDGGEVALAIEPPNDLLKNLLYYVAGSSTNDPKTKEIKQSFKLAEVMPDTKTLEKARADLNAPNLELMDTVSDVLREDLQQVKDALDIFMRSDDKNIEILKPVSEKLTSMADTLGMLSLGPQRKSLLTQVELINGLIDKSRAFDENELMEMASTIIEVEHALESMSEVTTQLDNEESIDTGEAASSRKQPKTSEERKLLESVVAEAKIDINAVKEAVSEFSRQLNHPEILNSVPGILDKVRGSLNILQLDRAAKLMSDCKGFVENNLIPSRTIPESETLDYLADTISSIEYYMESLVDSWGEPTAILNVAAESLAQLEKTMEEVKPTVRDPGASQDAINISGSVLTADSDDTIINLTSPLDDDRAAMEDSVDQTISDLAQPTFDEPETIVNLEQPDLDLAGDEIELNFDEDDTEVELEALDSEILGSEVLDSGTLEIEDTGDDRSLEIELEDVAEQVDLSNMEENKNESDSLELDLGSNTNSISDEIQRLDESLGLWFMDPISSDVASLVVEVIRNIEETISTKSISAAQNDEALKITSDMKQTVHRVSSNDEVFSDDTEKTMLWARDALVKYFSHFEEKVFEDLVQNDFKKVVVPETTSTIVEEKEEDLESGSIEIDEEIFEIFLEEAEEEFENISKNLPLWKNNLENIEPLKEMRRSFHTLKGSGRLVGANDLGEFAWAFESLLNRVIDKTLSATSELLDLVDRGREALPLLYELLKSQQRPDQTIFSLMEHADSICRGESFTPLSETISSMSIPQPDFTQFDADAAENSIELEVNDSIDKINRPDIDSVLLEIYRKEVATHLASLRNYIREWHENDIHEVTESLFRALHTLTGSARTTGVEVVSDLCLQLEHYIKLLQAEELLVSNEGIALIEDSTNRIDAICVQLGEDVDELYTTSDLVNRTIEMMTSLGSNAESGTTENNLSTNDKNTGLNSISIESDLALDDYDEELLEIFIEEGTEILDESDHTLHAWAQEPDNNEHVEALQRQLHTLKGGARMSGVSEIGDLSHKVESLIFNIVDGTIAPTENVFKVLQLAQDNLVEMLEQLKKHQMPHDGQSVLDEIERLIGKTDKHPDFDDSDESENNIAMEEVNIEPQEINDLSIDLNDDISVGPAINDLSIELTEELTSLAEELQGDAESDNASAINDEVDNSLDATELDIPELEIPELEISELEIAGNDSESGSQSIADKEDNDLPSFEMEEATPQKSAPTEQVRVRADTLNNLVNFAGEVSIYRSRLEQQVNSFRFNLQELDETVDRFRGQLRTFEIETEAQIQTRKEETLSSEHEHFDPLEFDRFTQMQQISRSMLESMNDIDSLRSILAGLNRESETLLVQQSRVNTELQEGLMSTRLVPFEKQVNRLKRIVRQTANEVGKLVTIEFDGTDIELDRAIVERMMPPIEHMLRNAIAHGIETPEQRQAAGKNEEGRILLQMNREGGDIVIQIIDDGAGIDADAIRTKAIEKGLIKEDASISEKYLIDMILESGFSTADEVTQIAGRGVGMDVVNNEIKQLGGVLNIDTVKNQGSTFTVSMPLSLAVSRALMIYVGDSMYAVPLMSVEGVERISYEQLVELQSEKNSTYKWIDEDFNYIHLGQLMDGGTATAPVEGGKAALLMVRSGNFRAALHIEGLVGSREIVIKPVGPQLSSLRGISGATIMGDGSVVLILDLGVLIRLALTENADGRFETEEVPEVIEEVVEEAKVPTVMVVDDSITVRKVTSRFLERNELDVIQAKDGIDALTQLLDVIPDVMLLDVEMPRMDGFELAINMRNDDRLKNIPIIMITSRTGQKHRDRAMNIGVNMYMGKPYNEIELLENIQTLLEADK